MQERFLEKRVEILERTVEGLSELPARVEALEVQVLQLRTEMRSEFSAVRTEMSGIRDELIARITAGDEETRRFMRVLHEEVIGRISVIGEGFGRRGKKKR
jgi:hypothetical protein